ncbi:MAG TPA: 5-deoxy-glucuronate isomerase [Nocardioides sp.]|uniref:5-deoxy-glucuronate isomerase n=1 Tax=Nocardioides sp. TaxID=35761 RepID=UPI002F3EFDA5
MTPPAATVSLHLPAGSAAAPGCTLLVTPQSAGWSYSGLAVLDLGPGESATWSTGPAETLVMSLAGSCRVTCDGTTYDVQGRADVFSGPSDFVYLPRDAELTVTSDAGGRFALPSAVCERRLPVRHQPADAVPVEMRGAGAASRQVNNFCTPEAFEADALIACEVLTPGGNWSSYPPHKHDEASATESVLEEIYYFEVADGPAGPGIAYQRVYGHDDREIDVLAEVRTGDVVLIPYGWHGPSMAVPGYDLYYLNVMAGPGEERAWRICDDPAHGWVRETWPDQQVDPRLPFGGGDGAGVGG